MKMLDKIKKLNALFNLEDSIRHLSNHNSVLCLVSYKIRNEILNRQLIEKVNEYNKNKLIFMKPYIIEVKMINSHNELVLVASKS